MNLIKQLFGDPCIGTTKGGIKIYVKGPGVSYIDPVELVRSDEVQQLLDDIPRIMQASKQRRLKGRSR